MNPPYDGAPMILGYIPSPSRGVIEVGPLELHAYGLMLAIGVLVAAMITEKRWTQWGRPGKEIGEIFIPVVIGGVVGARVYHLFTGYNWDAEGISGTFKIWQGGLSIWGVIAGGAIAVLIMARVKHINTLMFCFERVADEYREARPHMAHAEPKDILSVVMARMLDQGMKGVTWTRPASQDQHKLALALLGNRS